MLIASTVDSLIYLNCDDKPCQHGRCKDLYRKTDYECDCDSGWQGKNCDESLDNLGQENQDIIDTDKEFYDNQITQTSENFDKTLKKPEDPCGGQCKNNGYCDEDKKKCQVCANLIKF